MIITLIIPSVTYIEVTLRILASLGGLYYLYLSVRKSKLENRRTKLEIELINKQLHNGKEDGTK